MSIIWGHVQWCAKNDDSRIYLFLATDLYIPGLGMKTVHHMPRHYGPEAFTRRTLHSQGQLGFKPDGVRHKR